MITVKEICQDIIDSTLAKQFIPARGKLIRGLSNLLENFSGTPQEFCATVQCECCAKGALVIKWIEKFNNISRDEFLNFDYTSDGLPKDLVKLFGTRLLDEIEVAFELSFFSWADILLDRFYQLESQYSLYKNEDERLIAIMQDIIDDKF